MLTVLRKVEGLMALSKAEGPVDKLTILSKVERLTVLSKAEGRRCASFFVTEAYW